MARITTIACAFFIGIGLHGIALAGQPGSDWMPADKVKEKLMSSGYTSIIRLDADDGHWDGEGIKNGKVMEFDLDPKTGVVLGETEK
jgi:hypothetical protein